MLAYLFVVLAVIARFVAVPVGVTPVTGSLLFFGAYGSRRQLWFPFAMLAASDVVLTKFVYHFAFSWDHFVTWAWYAAIIWLGTRLRDNAKPMWVVASALASSVSFFLASNFAVWACWNMYPKNVAGLMASYAAALPFFHRSLAGDLVFTVTMFAVPVVVSKLSARSASSGTAAA
ncbi:MAG: hypothetical protein DMG97_32065 [Acidobacteria bacterium]|nr:MAG: hypothetical protein DMG98_02125 [Acidobacteriota bacterium]PYV65536.1 MAG: hypothetical protein DMG97_32065 [Acidobacteriota bacterium]PYV66432.1 MAG: hypothetical protein DMG96_42375 [Acidobacteriota bacterium]